MKLSKRRSIVTGCRKVLRFVKIYGLSRTLTKVAGRLRFFRLFKPKFLKSQPEIGLIGCGQFQFSTIAFFLSRGWTNPFLFCYDIDAKKAESLADYYSIKNVLKKKQELDKIEDPSLVYIASNHASHAGYSQKYLKKNIDVYCEKPIVVNFEQFDNLLDAIQKSEANFYVGYNRPYSSAIIDLKERVLSLDEAPAKFTLNCFISAHDIPDEHWYRDPKEGTRICGNVGHWLDLMIHIYSWRGDIPEKYMVQIAYADTTEPDENITISITSSQGDLTSITITARSEPFEGINESINFQYRSLIAKIDDFRSMTIWDANKITKKRYWPKDVGHKRAIEQPFNTQKRKVNEVIASTELMLRIANMVKNKENQKQIELSYSS